MGEVSGDCPGLPLSAAVIKQDQSSLERSGFITADRLPLVILIQGSQGRKSSRNLEVGAEAETMGSIAYGLASCFCLASFLM